MKNKGKVISDLQSSPVAKAMRLKRVRNFANLNRRVLSERFGINLHTYRGWEVGRHGGLSYKGAEKVIALAAEAGVACTVEWLLYGIGAGPQLINRNHCKMRENLANYTGDAGCSFVTNNQNDQLLMHELKTFRTNHSDTIDMFVQDDGMMPYYKQGELVAGVRYFDGQISKLSNQNCIVQTMTGLLLLRQLRAGSQSGRYNLACLNPSTSVNEPFIYNAELVSAAPVIWRRRR